MNAIFNILIAGKDIISYRPELNKITGSVTATILLQQILFRLNGQNEFYKFKEPCQHALYKEGDSWCEELGFTRREFDTAISNLKEKGFIKTRLTMDRITYYSIDECTLGKAISVLYEKAETYFTKSANPPLDNSIIFEETENTSENNITSEISNDISRPLEENSTIPTISKKETVRFKKPTLQELQEEIAQKGYSVNAEAFLDYYESKGWVVGKSPMKDWRAALRTWKRNETKFVSKPSYESKAQRNSRMIDEYIDEYFDGLRQKNDNIIDVELLQ